MLRQLRAVAAIFLAIGGVVLVPAVASAAPAAHLAGTVSARPADNWWQCSPSNPGYQCDGTDPADTGCANSPYYAASGTAWYYSGATLASTWQVQLYYSTACRTVWARLQLLSGSNNCPNCQLQVARSDINSVSTIREVGAAGGVLYSGGWTDQLYLPCGGALTGSANLWNFYEGTLGFSNHWFPQC